MDRYEIILASLSGEDNPGITAALMGVLAKHNVTILDIEQANIHKSLSLAFIFRSNNSGEVMKDLLFKATEIGIVIRFSPISDEHYKEWVASGENKDRYVLTLVGRDITAIQITKTAQIAVDHKLNIEKITRLTSRIPINGDEFKLRRSGIELKLGGPLRNKNKKKIREAFMQLSAEQGIDIAFQEENKYRRMRRLIFFDMDSTLIQTEVIDELAVRAGVGDQVKKITESAMRGEIDFSESFKKRISLLKGLDVSIMREIAENLPITEGLPRLVHILKKSGYKLAILSGGFTYFGNYLKEKYGFDYVYANELEIVDGKLTGKHLGDIVDGQRKAELLKLIAQVENVDIQQTVAVGDGANDLPMIDVAGLGIAFHAKPKVKENAKQSLSSVGIDGILYFLGYRDAMLIEKDESGL